MGLILEEVAFGWNSILHPTNFRGRLFSQKTFLMPLLKIILSFVLYTLISLINPSLITVKLASKLDA